MLNKKVSRSFSATLHARGNYALNYTSNVAQSASSPSDLERIPAAYESQSKLQPVTWLMLPRKNQLLLLFLCRMVDFLQVASLQAYVFYQLKSFDTTLADTVISYQAGVLGGCFTGAQAATSILWGKAADSRRGGRKMVLLIGLLGTAISCLGCGFATTYTSALCWRAFGGAINGSVGIIRTMIAEITKEKKYQSRAFLLLPMSFNVAGILGPVMGGLLADPVNTLPGLFGPKAVFATGWLQAYPYALPGILNALFLTITACFTLKTRRGKFDHGLHIGKKIWSVLTMSPTSEGYLPLDSDNIPFDMTENSSHTKQEPSIATPILSFKRIWTRNVIFTLITEAFFDFHLGAFTNLWSLFLSTSRSPSTSTKSNNLSPSSGGLGMPASSVGYATSILGILGMTLQLFLYPWVQNRLGTLRSFRYFLYLFPIAYLLAPYLSILPSSTPPPGPASGMALWIGITVVQLIQVTARTFTLPGIIILLNNCSPHPSVLGTIHGIGQSVSATFRTVGPIVAGWWYGIGLENGIVGASWWGTAGLAGIGCATAMWLYEGSGHEIYLPGEVI